MKVKTKKVEGVLNRLHVATPAPRDEKARPPCVPGKSDVVGRALQVQIASLLSL
jgi:hypothetical protein